MRSPIANQPQDGKGIIVEAAPEEPTTDIPSVPVTVQNGHVDEDDEDVLPAFPKRKRSSINYNLDEKVPSDEPSVKRPKQSQKIRGVIIGVWRDSDQPNDEDKHVIFGFIDIHDRLRTRIYGINRRGEELIGNIPLGPGGCWVTFSRIIFDPHLAPLSPLEVKEYVRIRSESQPEAVEEERQDANMKAVVRAQTIVQDAAAQDIATPPAKSASQRLSTGRAQNRQSLPRQPMAQTPSFKAVNAANPPTPKSSPAAADTKPTGVLLGYWADSSEHLPEDKHAVYGVVGGTDCFRVKVQRITRDGRYVDGNFPVGAGALWLHYDKVVFEPQLRGLSRPEMKEYVRIRQRDLENKETEKERKANEAKALREAKEVVASEGLNNGIGIEQKRPSPEVAVRHSSRTYAARQEAQADAATTTQKLRKEKAEAREKQHEKTRKEVAMAEAVVQEAAQQELRNNLKKLNKVWVAQQAATLPGTPPNEEIKYYNGIKYERKQNGPFQGKLVSQAQILCIDGEDFVEYRVLTKPSFF